MQTPCTVPLRCRKQKCPNSTSHPQPCRTGLGLFSPQLPRSCHSFCTPFSHPKSTFCPSDTLPPHTKPGVACPPPPHPCHTPLSCHSVSVLEASNYLGSGSFPFSSALPYRASYRARMSGSRICGSAVKRNFGVADPRGCVQTWVSLHVSATYMHLWAGPWGHHESLKACRSCTGEHVQD